MPDAWVTGMLLVSDWRLRKPSVRLTELSLSHGVVRTGRTRASAQWQHNQSHMLTLPNHGCPGTTSGNCTARHGTV